MKTDDDGIPTAALVKVRPNPSRKGCYLVTVVCPHCGHNHSHGENDEGLASERSHRLSHCWDEYDSRRDVVVRRRPNPGYYLPMADIRAALGVTA